MLRGSYAGGSLAVTARCPCATTASVSAFASTAPSSGLSQVRPLRPSCMPASRLPRPARSPRGTLPDLVSTATRRLALPSYAPAIHGFATPLRIRATLCRRTAKPSRAFALTRGVSRRHAIAEHSLGVQCFSVAKLCLAVPLRRVRRCAPPFLCAVLHFKSSAAQISDELCLRQALLRKATPSLPVSVHRRRMPRLCFAVACAALLLSAVAVLVASWPSYPMPLRIGSLPVLRGAVRCAAFPLP